MSKRKCLEDDLLEDTLVNAVQTLLHALDVGTDDDIQMLVDDPNHRLDSWELLIPNKFFNELNASALTHLCACRAGTGLSQVGTIGRLLQAMGKDNLALKSLDLHGKVHLVAAVQEQSTEIVRSLLDYKVDPNLCSTNNRRRASRTAIAQTLYTEIDGPGKLRLLLQRGANPNIPCQDESWEYKELPTFVAMKYDLPDMLQILLDGGADANATNRDGKTLQEVAKTRQDQDSVVNPILDIVGGVVSMGQSMFPILKPEWPDLSPGFQLRTQREIDRNRRHQGR